MGSIIGSLSDNLIDNQSDQSATIDCTTQAHVELILQGKTDKGFEWRNINKHAREVHRENKTQNI